jgi:hypothetical protein
MTSPSLTLNDLQQLVEPDEILRGTSAYLERLRECEAEAHRLRRIAYRSLAAEYGSPHKAAKAAGVSVTTIKNALLRAD